MKSITYLFMLCTAFSMWQCKTNAQAVGTARDNPTELPKNVQQLNDNPTTLPNSTSTAVDNPTTLPSSEATSTSTPNATSTPNSTSAPTATATPVSEAINAELLEKVGAKFYALSKAAITINAYHLKEGEKDSTATGYQGYKVVQRDTLSAEEVKQFNALMADRENFWISNVGKRCEFYPNMGIELKGPGGTTHVLIAFSCDVLTIKVDGVKKHNFDYGHTAFTRYGNRIFPEAFTKFLEISDAKR